MSNHLAFYKHIDYNGKRKGRDKMDAIKIRENVYWVGAIDYTVREFHGYSTHEGSTYNAYLIIDDKITLIDTVKEVFADELIARIRSVIDPASIDVVIANHGEPDHSGSLPRIMELATKAKVYTSAPNGIKSLTAHYGEFDYVGVKTGDTLSIGKHSFQFVQTPMLHWPDNMVSYCPEEKILFSNDAYGQHYASGFRYDDEEGWENVYPEAKKYFANILLPYRPQAVKANEIVKGLDLDLICPSHGIIWRSYISNILKAYDDFAMTEGDGSAVVVYDSMWHSTEVLARTITDAFTEKGVHTKLYDLKVSDKSDIMTDILSASYIAVGSPTLNNTMMASVAGFLNYMKGLSPKRRKAFAFGSYGWGGQSVGEVENELKNAGLEICLPMVKINYRPGKQDLQKLHDDILSL